MIVQCQSCQKYFEDVYRSTLCPHDAFAANDGHNNFKVHDDAYLSKHPIPSCQMNPLKKEGEIYKKSLDALSSYLVEQEDFSAEHAVFVASCLIARLAQNGLLIATEDQIKE